MFEDCEECNGTGEGLIMCSWCNGTGDSLPRHEGACHVCRGRGETLARCGACAKRMKIATLRSRIARERGLCGPMLEAQLDAELKAAEAEDERSPRWNVGGDI